MVKIDLSGAKEFTPEVSNEQKALDAIRAYPKEAIVLLVTHSREDAEALGAEIIEI